ncbi:MAG: hypothetical protein ACT4QC_23050 [Planctomycetaceae bacterium]
MELQTAAERQDALADRVERLIRQRTSGLIRSLRVEVLADEVVVTGRAATYYAKQLATHAALDACDHLTLTNDIEVF